MEELLSTEVEIQYAVSNELTMMVAGDSIEEFNSEKYSFTEGQITIKLGEIKNLWACCSRGVRMK